MGPSNPTFYDKFNQFLHDVAAYVASVYGVHLDISLVQIPLLFVDNVTATPYFDEFFASSPNFGGFTIIVPEQYAQIFTTVPAMAIALLRQLSIGSGIPIPQPLPSPPQPAPVIKPPINPIGAATPDGQRWAVAPGYPLQVGSTYTAPDGTQYVMQATPSPFGNYYYWVKQAPPTVGGRPAAAS